MVDPFDAAARRERITQAGGLLLLLALLCLMAFVWVRTDVSDGEEVSAVVERFGTHPELGTGDLPILTVTLPDGSARQVRASWEDVKNCVPGSRISLVQRGTALQVGLRGCVGDR